MCECSPNGERSADSKVRRRMKLKFTSLIIIMALLLLGAGAVFLATWDIPAPSVAVEKTISNDRFAR